MIKKIIISIIIILLSSPTFTHANEEVGVLAKSWFTTFSAKISAKYSIEKEVLYFESLSKKLDLLLITKNFNTKQIKLVNDLIKLSNEYISKQEKYLNENENKKLIEQNKLMNEFKYKSFNNENLFLENGVWYTYIYEKHLFFDENNDSINGPTLDGNNINKNSTIVFVRDDGKFGFINDYEKRKLISDSIIYGIPGKYNFLKELKDDKRKLNQETDKVFIALKEISKNLTVGKTESEKIKILYKYVISNISYTENFSFDKPEVFSGIHTFAYKNGVCEGYVKLFLYMLNFSNLNHSEVIRGYVLDATDFPEVGHAWIKIGNKYYDPTFDDPVGQLKTKDFSEYNYFGLPYDLFYTNRYNFEKIPNFLKEKSIEYREAFIKKRTSALLNKYKDSGYNILKPYILKYENNIELTKDLDIEDLKKIIKYFEVDNWSINENGIDKKINNINYYKIEDSKVETIIKQLNYKLDGYYLFKWKLDNGSYEYRLAYDVFFS